MTAFEILKIIFFFSIEIKPQIINYYGLHVLFVPWQERLKRFLDHGPLCSQFSCSLHRRKLLPWGGCLVRCLGLPSSRTRMPESPPLHSWLQLPAIANPERQQVMLGPCQPYWRPTWCSWLLFNTCPLYIYFFQQCLLIGLSRDLYMELKTVKLC